MLSYRSANDEHESICVNSTRRSCPFSFRSPFKRETTALRVTTFIQALVAGFLVLQPLAHLRGEESLQFRGPSGNGVLSDSIPKEWDSETNVRWVVDVPGGGWSSPIAVQDRIFLTTAVGEGDTGPVGFSEGTQTMGDFYKAKAPDKPYRFQVLCLNATNGETRWNKTIVVQKPPHKIHPSNSYATESPVTDGEHVYVYFASVGVVACLDNDGEEVWRQDLGAYKTSNDFGTSSSLALLDKRLFVQCDNEEKSFLCALDTKTGQQVWRDDRDGGTSWSSPVIWENRVRKELVTCGNGDVTGYDPETGDVLWRLTEPDGAYSSTPTFDQERLYLGQSGRNSRGPLVAVNAGATGDLTLDKIGQDALAWVEPKSGPGICSPVIAAGYVYVLSRGILSCHDAATGERMYRERLDDASRVTASLWTVGDKVFAISESGQTVVVQAGKEFQLVDTNPLEGLFWSTPSQTESDLLIRSSNRLFCIAK